MRTLYDKDLPVVANKIIKKSGAKVEPRKLERGRAILPTNVRWATVAVAMPNGGSGWGVKQGPNGDVVATHFGMREASDDVDARNALELEKLNVGNPVIPITADLRTAVLGGQAYFQSPHDTDAVLGQPQRQRPSGVKGSLRFDPSKRFTEQRELTLSLFEGHDASTVIHESAHIFLEMMQDLAQTSPAIAADLAVLKAWAHDPDNSGPLLSEYQHEQIAIAFETYVMEGRAPSVELRGVFAHMRAWMLDVYRAVKGGLVPGLDRKVNDEVRAVSIGCSPPTSAIRKRGARATSAPDPPDAGSRRHVGDLSPSSIGARSRRRARRRAQARPRAPRRGAPRAKSTPGSYAARKSVRRRRSRGQRDARSTELSPRCSGAKTPEGEPLK